MNGWLQWLPALLICLGLATAAWRLRLRAAQSAGERLETLGSTPLGPSQRLVAVRAGQTVYLLAVSQREVAKIGETTAESWNETSAPRPPAEAALGRAASSGAGE